MGNWVIYQLSLVKETEKLADKLIDKGFAVRESIPSDEGKPKNRLRINLERLSPELLSEMRENGYEENTITLTETPDGLCYANKWIPDDRLCFAISKALPEDVIMVSRRFEWQESLQWYMKNGVDCNQIGVPIHRTIYNISLKVVRECRNGNFAIRLPIGEGDDKWGTIFLPKENVTLWKYLQVQGDEVIRSVHAFFTEPEYKVSFLTYDRVMSSEEIVNRYYESIEQFRNYKNELMKVSTDAAYQVRGGDENQSFYIVEFACPRGIVDANGQILFSSSGKLSIAVPNFYFKEDEITLGARGSKRSVVISSSDNRRKTIYCTNEELSRAITALEREQETIEEEQEEELEMG